MNVPSIGSARGIFEIFIPGVFLLLNIMGFVYLFPGLDQTTRDAIQGFSSNEFFAAVVIIAFGYLIGVLLRLLKTKWPDRLSAVCCWFCYARDKRYSESDFSEPFPFINYLGKLSKNNLPVETLNFYNAVWLPRMKERGNREFFNYWKVMLDSKDERTIIEVYAAEAMCRYISGMFYALFVSLGLLIANAALTRLSPVMIVLGLCYLVGILIILLNFRLLRVKEVETVFAASMKGYKEHREAVLSNGWPSQILEAARSDDSEQPHG